MLVVMEMSTGKIVEPSISAAYGDEVLDAGWVDFPVVEARLEEVVSQPRQDAGFSSRGFMATFYAAQE